MIRIGTDKGEVFSAWDGIAFLAQAESDGLGHCRVGLMGVTEPVNAAESAMAIAQRCNENGAHMIMLVTVGGESVWLPVESIGLAVFQMEQDGIGQCRVMAVGLSQPLAIKESAASIAERINANA